MGILSNRHAQQKIINLEVLSLVSFAKVAVWCSIFRLLLDIIYVNFIAVRWAFYGFTYETPTFFSYVGSWILTLIVAVCITQLMKLRIFSSIVLQCLLIIAFLPSVVLYTYMSEASEMYSYYILYWGMLLLFFFIICNRAFRPVQFAVNESFLAKLSVFFFFLCVFVWSVYSRFHIQLDILDVYEQRRLAARFGMPLPLAYLFGGAQICVPFLAIWALTQKRKLIFLINVAAQLIAFFSTGSKLAFFALLVGIVAYYALTIKKTYYYTTIVLVGASLLNVFSIIESVFRNTYFLSDSLIRRIMFLPGLINIYYYDFFISHEYDYFRSTILRFLTSEDLYIDKIQKVIGGIYFNRPNMYTNNGLFSDAYMNLGILGMFIMPLLLVLLLRFFDICIGYSDVPMMLASAVYLIINLLSSSFFTNLFSHGFIMLALLFCFLRKEDSIILRIGR